MKKRTKIILITTVLLFVTLITLWLFPLIPKTKTYVFCIPFNPDGWDACTTKETNFFSLKTLFNKYLEKTKNNKLAKDDDGDGVPNYKDSCKKTPTYYTVLSLAKVDEKGCPDKTYILAFINMFNAPSSYGTSGLEVADLEILGFKSVNTKLKPEVYIDAFYNYRMSLQNNKLDDNTVQVRAEIKTLDEVQNIITSVYDKHKN